MIHIFRAGTYQAMSGQTVSIGAADLAATASAYDPAIHEAPIVIGHPATDDPAYGWVAALAAAGDDLEAEPKDVDAAFAEALAAGRYRKISASFWPPDHMANPKQGVWSLRHVGFLGAAAPAVKGLRPAHFAADDGAVTVEFSISTLEQTMSDNKDPTVDLAEREAAIAAKVAELAGREAAIKQAEIAAERAKLVVFCEHLADEARIRPADVAPLVSVLAALPPEVSADFADPVDATHAPRAPIAWVRSWLAGLPPLVELAEVVTAKRAGQGAGAPSDAEIATRARAYHRKMKTAGTPVSFAAAVDAATAGTDKE